MKRIQRHWISPQKFGRKTIRPHWTSGHETALVALTLAGFSFVLFGASWVIGDANPGLSVVTGIAAFAVLLSSAVAAGDER